MLIVYTGRGKGKTSAAIGTMIRALMNNKKVLYVQFMKSTGNAISKLNLNFKFYSNWNFGFVDPKNITKKHIESVRKTWNFAKENFDNYDLIILDELNVVLLFNMLDKKEVINTLKKYQLKEINKPKPYDWPIIVITGIDACEEIIQISDLVTEMKEIKHPFKKGYLATRGIDF